MYTVFWLESENGTDFPRASQFNSDELKLALEFMEVLRSRQRGGAAIGFVTMSSENPDSVGPPGVAETGAEYNWKKRRR